MKRIALALVLCVGCAALAQDPAFVQAVQDHQAGHWSSAYARFFVLANSGNVEAARIALFMHRHGKLLYNSDWAASEDDLALWGRMTGVRPHDPEVERVASGTAVRPPVWRARMIPFSGRTQATGR